MHFSSKNVKKNGCYLVQSINAQIYRKNILHSAFLTADKPPSISHLIFPNIPICIQTYTPWYLFAPQICDEVDRQMGKTVQWSQCMTKI